MLQLLNVHLEAPATIPAVNRTANILVSESDLSPPPVAADNTRVEQTVAVTFYKHIIFLS